MEEDKKNIRQLYNVYSIQSEWANFTHKQCLKEKTLTKMDKSETWKNNKQK